MDTWWYGIRQRPLSWSRHICMLGTAATGTGTGNLQQANLQQPTCNLSAIIVAQKCKAFLCRRLLRLILKHRRVNWCLWWRWIVLMWLVVATATCYMQHATPMRSLARNLPWNFKHWRISAISFILYMYIHIYIFSSVLCIFALQLLLLLLLPKIAFLGWQRWSVSSNMCFARRCGHLIYH